MDTTEKQAQAIVRKYMYFCAGAGLVPVPFLDIGSVSVLQMDMLRHICQTYNIPFDDSLVKRALLALVGSSVPRIAASLIKAIPGIGTWIGDLSMAVLAATSTYAIGQVFIQHFEAGGNMHNFKVSDFKKVYDELLVKGKEMADTLLKNKGQFTMDKKKNKKNKKE